MAGILDWFTEGFDTANIKEATRLLGILGKSDFNAFRVPEYND
jgi:hypothetical protein